MAACSAGELTEKIKVQGDVVRQMKKDKKPKEEVILWDRNVQCDGVSFIIDQYFHSRITNQKKKTSSSSSFYGHFLIAEEACTNSLHPDAGQYDY